MIDVPAALVERLERGQAILVAGLGCSRLLGSPGWDELALRMVDHLDDVGRRMQVAELITDGRCADAIAYLGTRIGRGTLIEVLVASYSGRPEVPSVLAGLGRIPWRGVISTSYDGVWPAIATGSGDGQTALFGPEDGDQVPLHQGRFSWQMAGVVSTPETLNLGVFEGRRAQLGPSAPTLRALAEQASLVFVGFRPGDPDLRYVLRQIADSPGVGPHFLITAGGDRDLEPGSPEADLGLLPVPIEGTLEAALGILQATLTSSGSSTPVPSPSDTDNEVSQWLDVLARDEANAEARVMLARAEARLRADKNWRGLVGLLLGRVESTSDRDERVAILRGLARVYDGPLETPDRAFTALATAFRLDPQAAGLLDDLERVAGKAGTWDELSAVVDEVSGGGTAEEVAVEITADIPPHGERRRDTADFAERPRHRIERRGDPSLLERHERALVEGDATAVREALEALPRLYRQSARWADLVRVLDEKAKRAVDPAAAAALRRERADVLAERLDDLAAGVRELESVLAQSPHDRPTLYALEKMHMQAGREVDALLALERLVEVAESDGERVLLLRRLAARWEVAAAPDALDRAAAALDRILRANPRDAETMRALSRVLWQAERWPALIEALTRQLEATESPLGRREHWATLGSLYDEKLHDTLKAADAYAKAMALGDERETTLAPRARLEEQAGRWPAALDALDKLAAATSEPAARADALVRAARIADEQLRDRKGARDRYARALELAPEDPRALRALADIYRADGDLLRAVELLRDLEMQTDDFSEKARVLYERGVLLEDGLGDSDEATALFARGLVMDPNHLPTAARLADLHARAGRWDVLVPVLETLARAAEQTDGPDAALLYCRLGEAAHRAGETDRALAAYETARRLAPGMPAALLGLAALRLQRSEWAQAAALYQALVDAHQGALVQGELVDVHVNLGRCRAELGYRAAAIDAYAAAEALAPQREDTVRRLVDLYTAEGRWKDAATAWLRLADLAERPVPRAKCFYGAAVIQRDNIGDREQAVALFNRALDHAPGMTKAFDAIERLQSEAADWEGLAQSYRRMIERLPTQGFSELRLRLWSALANLSLEHLHDLESAATALDVAAFLDPGNLARREMLADVYLQSGPDFHDKAIAEYQWLLAHNPDRLACYRALANLYGETGEPDKLWCVAAALVFLRKAEPELQRFYDDHRPRQFCAAKRPFDEDVWSKVVHPNEDPAITAIFTLVGDLVATAMGAPTGPTALQRDDRVDLAVDTRLPTRALRYVTGVLGLRPPELFFRDTEPAGIALRDRREFGVPMPALVIGKGVEQRTNESELVFEIAKRVAFLRPGRFVRHALGTASALDAALRAALALDGSEISPGGHNGEVSKLTAELRRLVPRTVATRVSEVGQKLAAARGETIDIQAWMTAADLSAARVGFVLTNDLPCAARVISAEPSDTSPLPAKQRLKDLLVYSVSESYFAVRKRLGLDIMQSDATPRIQAFQSG